KTLPQTSPLYAVGNKQVPDPADPTRTVDTVAKTLTDVRPDPANGWGQHGAHTRNVLGAFNPPVDAVLIDTPRRALDFDGQEWRQTFEVAALALDGPMAGTYLGSVEWGWLTDATGTAALSPTPISMVRFGAPSGDFMAAARKWNRMTFQDTATGTSYDSVDLPTTLLESGGVPPKAMSTAQLAARIAEVTRELAAVDAVAAMTVLGTPVMNLDPDRKSKALEKRALEAELALRADQPTVPLATHEAAAAALGTRAVIARLGQLAAEIPPLPTGADRTNRELERHALEAQLRTRSLKLSVTVHETEDVFGSDTVYATVSLAGKSHRSGTGDLNNGESRDIVVPLSSLLPAPLPPADAFAIRLYDEDWEGDDLMLDDSWPAPYAAHRSIQSRDGGKYEVLVDFDR
ncbi:MAG TPA: hypothetical protein VFR81_02660, partial [Longimicrobium sp.]|nr:hypothetical protein [Longimicrobium sp.]